MAKIFQINSRTRVPDLSQVMTPTLDVPVMDFNSIESALDSYSTQEENDISNAEENFSSLAEYHDELIGERFDNQRQKEVFEKARQDIGIGDSAFKMSLDELRDPFKVRGVRSKVGQIYERADVKDIMFEQQRGKDYLDTIVKYKDMNPVLYKKALAKYNKYRNGEISGFDLLPQEFTPVDVDKTLSDSLKLVPQINTSEMKEKYEVAYEEVVAQRSKEVIEDVVEMLKSNSAFRNNLEAMFTDENGTYNKKAADKYINRKAEEFAKKNIDIENSKVVSRASGSDKVTTFDRMLENIKALGGTDSGIVSQIAAIEDITKNKDKSLIRIEESGNEVRIVYSDNNSDGDANGEHHIIVPRSDSSISENPNVGYSIPTTDGDEVSITDEDISTYLQDTEVIEDSHNINPLRKSHKSPLEGTKSNVGQKPIAKVEGDVLITNDIEFLIDNGIVPRGTDYDELEDFGFEYQVEQGGYTTVRKPIKTNKKSIPAEQIEIYAPNRGELETKLVNNPVISKYDKEGDKYKSAVMFLGSPELQDGYFQEVYLQEDYQEYLDSVKSVAPLQDNGFFDTSDVHKDLKPLIENNPEEKLAYLAHHHGNKSGAFLEFGKTKIKGNANADTDLKVAWERIDKILEENPGMEFFEVLKKVESGNSYDAVYQGKANSSAIGKYQILFDTHYKKIRKYIADNFDKLQTAEIKPVEESKEKQESNNPFEEDF